MKFIENNFQAYLNERSISVNSNAIEEWNRGQKEFRIRISKHISDRADLWKQKHGLFYIAEKQLFSTSKHLPTSISKRESRNILVIDRLF